MIINFQNVSHDLNTYGTYGSIISYSMSVQYLCFPCLGANNTHPIHATSLSELGMLEIHLENQKNGSTGE